MTRLFTDEQLSVYLDGAGDPEISTAIDQALATDTILQKRLERFQRADVLLREVIDTRLGDVPSHLAQVAAGQVATADFGAGRRVPARRIAQFAALAASLLVAFGIGMQLGQRLASPSSTFAFGAAGLTAGPVLAHAISTAYSGEPVQTQAGTVSVMLSFRSSQGDLCRRFQLMRGAEMQTAVACRRGGQWLIEGMAASPSQPGSGSFTTASGPSDAAIDTVIKRLGIARALNRDQEKDAIKSGWHSKPQ